MAGRASKATEQAKAAFEKSGGTLKVLELCHRFKLAPSTIYRTAWWKQRRQQDPKAHP